jgi:hypothetical protein
MHSGFTGATLTSWQHYTHPSTRGLWDGEGRAASAPKIVGVEVEVPRHRGSGVKVCSSRSHDPAPCSISPPDVRMVDRHLRNGG